MAALKYFILHHHTQIIIIATRLFRLSSLLHAISALTFRVGIFP